MSSDAVGWVFRRSPLAGPALCVHLAIADSVNDQFGNEFWMGKPTLARKTRLSLASVKRSISIMVDTSLLEVLEESPGKNASKYRMLFPDLPVIFDSRSPSTGSVGTGSARTGTRANRVSQSRQPSLSVAPTGSLSPKTESHKEISQEIPRDPKRASLVGSKALVVAPSVGTAQAPSDEVMGLCNLLADLIAKNGSRRPDISKTWLIECDRLIRIDGHTPAQIERAIRWCQTDPFWRSNILSMPTLRAQYDKLRLAAQRHSAPAPINRTDQRVMQAMAWATQQEAR